MEVREAEIRKVRHIYKIVHEKHKPYPDKALVMKAFIKYFGFQPSTIYIDKILEENKPLCVSGGPQPTLESKYKCFVLLHRIKLPSETKANQQYSILDTVGDSDSERSFVDNPFIGYMSDDSEVLYNGSYSVPKTESVISATSQADLPAKPSTVTSPFPADKPALAKAPIPAAFPAVESRPAAVISQPSLPKVVHATATPPVPDVALIPAISKNSLTQIDVMHTDQIASTEDAMEYSTDEDWDIPDDGTEITEHDLFGNLNASTGMLLPEKVYTVQTTDTVITTLEQPVTPTKPESTGAQDRPPLIRTPLASPTLDMAMTTNAILHSSSDDFDDYFWNLLY